MAKTYQVQALHKMLSAARYPVSRIKIMEILECSDSTVTRVIAEMKNSYGAPIKFDRKQNGYYYNKKEGEIFELPGIWFNESELYALLVTQQLLIGVQPGLFEPHIKPLISKISKILLNSHRHPDRIFEKVKILYQAHRLVDGRIFQELSSALLDQKQINIDFYNRASNKTDNRDISPLRLIYYRDNWYTDAWCHKKKAFRTFSVTNISSVKTLNKFSQLFDSDELDNYFASAYGIFSGKADKIAILHFNQHRARWVADENWHPEQKSRWLKNGDYELQIPYSDHRELMMDILKYGADVVVKAPPELIQQVKQEIIKNMKNY